MQRLVIVGLFALVACAPPDADPRPPREAPLPPDEEPPDPPDPEPLCVRLETTSDPQSGTAIRVRERSFDEWGDEVRTRIDGEADGVFEHVDERTFNAFGQLEERRSDTDGDGDLDEIETSFYEGGALVERWLDTDLDGFPDRDHEIFAYNDAGQRTMHVIDRDGDFDPDFVETRTYLPNAEHLPLTIERDDNGDGVLEYRAQWAYDGDRMVRHEEDFADDGVLEFTVDVFDEGEREIEVWQTFDNGALIAGTRFEREDEQTVRREDLVTGQVILLVEAGPLEFLWRVENNGGPLGLRTLALNEQNQVLSQFHDDDGDGEPEQTFVATYDDDAQRIESTAMRVLEDGTVRTTHTDTSGELEVTTIAVHDASGALISREVYEFVSGEAEPRSVLVEDASGPISRVRYDPCE